MADTTKTVEAGEAEDIATQLRRELATVYAQIAALEQELAELVMRQEGGAAFAQESNHYRALALALAWPYSYAQIRLCLRELGMHADGHAMRAWLRDRAFTQDEARDGTQDEAPQHAV